MLCLDWFLRVGIKPPKVVSMKMCFELPYYAVETMMHIYESIIIFDLILYACFAGVFSGISERVRV